MATLTSGFLASLGMTAFPSSVFRFLPSPCLPSPVSRLPLYLSAMPSPSRRQTVTTLVGKVAVGSGHPIVVQSMTNTDTADVEGTIAQVAALAQGGKRAGARHGQQRGGRGRRPSHCRRPGPDRRLSPHHRGLSLQRPPAAHQVSRLRPGPRQVPHQSRQRGRQARRPELPGHHRSRAAERTSRSASA